MATLFTRIIQGEIPSYTIAEDDDYFAFLDINPLSRGHTLVIPRQETDYLFDLDEELLAGDPDSCIRIPMITGARSLNLSNAAALVVYEAMRQHGYPGLDLTGPGL